MGKEPRHNGAGGPEKAGPNVCGAITVVGNVIGKCGAPATHRHPRGEQHAGKPGWLCDECYAFAIAHPEKF